MTHYIDFNIKARRKADLKNIKKLANILGYSEIVIETPLKINEFNRQGTPRISRRLTLQGSSIESIRKRLGRERYKYEIISICCEENKTAKWAAQDNRVDTFIFPTTKTLRLFDISMAKLAKKFQKAIEIPLIPLIKHAYRERTGLIRGYFRAVKIAQKAKCPIILSSGADSLLEMRAPKDMACFAEVFALTEKLALEGLSTIPEYIISENKKKLGSSFVIPGVSLDEEEEE